MSDLPNLGLQQALDETARKDIRRLRRNSPDLVNVINRRWASWPVSMRDQMLVAIAQAERVIEKHHFSESQS